MGDSSRTARVSHPILRLEVVRPDGARTTAARVFCRYQRRSIDAEACVGCVHCDAITGGPRPAIACTIPVSPEELEPDPVGDKVEVGAVLTEGTVALDPGASLRDAFAVLRSADRRSIAVVDEERGLVGIVHEVTFVKPVSGIDQVAAAMSSGLALHESTPLRPALRFLASAHLREATVVDDAGVPLGVFRDVDGLRYLALARAKRAT